MVRNDSASLLKKLLKVMENIYLKTASALLAAIIIVSGTEIVSRTMFDYSFYWVQEFTVVCCGYIIFLGAVIVFRRKGDIVIAVIHDNLPRKAAQIVSIFHDVLMVSFILLAIKASIEYIRFIWGGFIQTMLLPTPFVYLPLLICFSSLLLVILDWLIDDIAALVARGSHEAQI